MSELDVSLVATADAEWGKALRSVPHDIYHHPDFVELEARRLGGEGMAIVVRSESNTFFLPLILRPVPGLEDCFDATSAYGYPGPTTTERDDTFSAQAIIAALERLAQANVGAVFVREHPIINLARSGYGDVGQRDEHGPTIWIDTTESEEAQWGAYASTTRNLVRRLRRDGFSARIDPNWDRLQDFVSLYEATMRGVGAGSTYYFEPWYYEGLRDRLGDHVDLWLVERDGELTCAGLFTHIDGMVQYHLSGSDPRWARQSPTRLMLDEVRQWATSAGMRRFHLGGGYSDGEDSLFRFKEKFSKKRVRFSSWRAVANQEVYRRAMKRYVPDENLESYHGFFPAYRRGLKEGQVGEATP